MKSHIARPAYFRFRMPAARGRDDRRRVEGTRDLVPDLGRGEDERLDVPSQDIAACTGSPSSTVSRLRMYPSMSSGAEW
jgi:hypothetical protein